MCQECDGRKDAIMPAALRAGSLSRRSMLAMGASLAAGVFMGLWSCQEGNPRPAGGGTSSGGSSAPANAATAASSPAIASSPTETSPATTHLAAPDLGSAVFPNAQGIAIAQPGDAPVIVIPRTDWTAARPRLTDIEVMNGIQHITVHHTAMILETDAWRPTAGELETIREFHAGTRPTDRQWADIAYHFAVDRAGRVWQARPLAYQGAHVKGHNEHNLGIVVLGNFETQSPAAAQLTALATFIRFLRQLYHVPLAEVFTHGELGMTSCPGKALQAYMDRARRNWAQEEGITWQPVTRPAAVPAPGQSGSL